MSDQAVERRLAAIMFTDIVGYTALMAESEEKGNYALDRGLEVLPVCLEEADLTSELDLALNRRRCIARQPEWGPGAGNHKNWVVPGSGKTASRYMTARSEPDSPTLPPRRGSRGHVNPGRSVRQALRMRPLGLLVLGLLAFHGGLPLPAHSSHSPQQLKRDAITTLEQISATDRELQRTITRAIEHITRSLSDKGHALFLDAFRILPPSQGNKVFERERQAVERLRSGLARDDTPEDIKTVFQEVINALVEADRAIAALSIATAQQLVQTGGGNPKKLPKAQREFERAVREAEPRRAIERFEKAWGASQEVVDAR